MIVGDVNSNAIWDEWDRWWNHSDVVNELKGIGIESIYHKIYNEQHGKELTPTLFFQRKIERPYHIDYVFAPEKFIKRTRKFEIGHPDKWLKFSDHMPIVLELNP